MMRYNPARERAMQAVALTPEQVRAGAPGGFFDGSLTAPAEGIAAGTMQTSGLLYGAAGSLVRGYNQVLQWQDNLTRLVGLPDSRKIGTEWLDQARDNTLAYARSFKPDPVRTGMAGQIMFDLSRIMTQVGTGAATAAATGGVGATALLTGAATTGTSTTYGKFHELRKDGVDDKTALQVAAIEGAVTGGGVMIPASIGYRIGANVAYGAGANIGIGITERSAVHELLKDNYPAMAAHYQPLDTAALIAEGALGAIFGAVGARAGLRHSAQEITDAAMVARDAKHAAIDTAPGIPADPATANAHAKALNTAIDQLLAGDPVDVSDTRITDGNFVLRPNGNDIQTIAREHYGTDASKVADSRVQELLALDDAPVVLQNRNRASAASISQMNAIAAAPDYLRTGMSRSMDQGAPVVFGNADVLPDSAVLGRTETVTDGTGARIETRYAVLEADDVLTSNLADGSPVAAYAEGQPGKVRTAAGNGRAAGLNAAYERGNADTYRAELRADAQNIGIDAKAIDAMRQPMLVRVMRQADIRPDIGDASNISASAVLSPVEQAANDARRIDMVALEFDDHGNPTPETLRAFVAAMPESERAALMNPDGSPTRQAQDRIMAAAFQQAYGNEELVRLFAQATDTESRNVIKALASAAARMARLADAGEFDVRDLVAQAGVMAVNARRQGLKLSDLVKQIDLDADPQVYAVADFLARNLRSGAKISEGLRRLADTAAEQLETLHANETQANMFGEQPVLTRGQVLDTLKGAEPETGQLTPQARAELMQRFERAGQIKPRFDAALARIAEETGATLQTAPIKGVERAVEKIVNDYAGKASRIKDLVRATLVVNNAEQLAKVLKRVLRVFGKDPKRNGLMNDADVSPEGYRDALIEVEIDGFPAELQINTPEMMAAKDKAHPLYVEKSRLERKIESENREPTASEQKEIDTLAAQQRNVYAPAWEATKARNWDSLRGAPLRENESDGNLRPPGTSQAMATQLGVRDTGISSTSANRVPSGKDSGSSIDGIVDPPDGILPLTAARVGDDLETRAGLALLEERGDVAVAVELESGDVVQVSLQDALREADAENSYMRPDTLDAAVVCKLTRG